MNLRKILSLCLALFALSVLDARGQAPQPGVPQAPVQGPVVKSIEVQYAGPANVSKEKIIANMRTRVGKPYDDKTVEEDIRNLYATGNITNVRIFGEPAQDGVKVIVVVAAKAQITEVMLNGVTTLKPGRIRKQITAKPGDSLNEASLEADKQKILQYYADKGYPEVDVEVDVQSDDKLGTARVTFNVTEGVKTIIGATKFEGNANVKTADLMKVVKSKPRAFYDILSKAGRLNKDAMQDDITAIKEVYQTRGYVDVEVGTPRVDRNGSKVTIVFPITEGPVYHVGKVKYEGAQVFPIDKFTKLLKIKEGAIYSPQAVRTDIKAIEDVYGAIGYVDLRVGAAVNPAGGTLVDVEFKLEEGVQSYVEHVHIQGNTRTKDKVIRREVLVTPGDVYNTVRVDASKTRLMNTTYFSKVEVYPGDTLVPGRKDVNILVEEKRTGSFNFGAGFSSIDSLIGFAEITQGNFDITRWPYFTGGGQKFRLRVQYGTRRKDFILALTEPYFLDYKISVGGEIFFRDASFVSDVYDEQRYGFDINARKAINDFTYFRAGYRLENINIHNVADDATETIKSEEGSKLKSEINGGITYDTRDSLFLTRKGERVDFNGFINGGFLGGDIQTYGLTLAGSKYFSLPWDTILILNGEVSIVNTWGSGTEVPIYDRLYLGGSNNLRGFKFRDVGPKDSHGEPIGGSTLARLTVEYTVPIVEKVRGALFYDIGFVNGGEFSFGTNNVNSDVGIGVRLDLPIGPVRIDYGIPLQKDNFSSSSGKFNFNIGYQF
jgi:outer membrane protein insertion porin family